MITYTKLKSGDWGLRSTTPLVAGQVVTVTKKDGGKKTETVDRVLWQGDGITLASIKQSGGSGRSNGRSNGAVCAECGRGGKLVTDMEDGLRKHYGCCDIPPGGY